MSQSHFLWMGRKMLKTVASQSCLTLVTSIYHYLINHKTGHFTHKLTRVEKLEDTESTHYPPYYE